MTLIDGNTLECERVKHSRLIAAVLTFALPTAFKGDVYLALLVKGQCLWMRRGGELTAVRQNNTAITQRERRMHHFDNYVLKKKRV